MPFLALMYFWGFRRHTPYGDSYYYFFNCMLSWAPHCCFTLFSKIVFNVCACACKCDCPNKYYYYYTATHDRFKIMKRTFFRQLEMKQLLCETISLHTCTILDKD